MFLHEGVVVDEVEPAVIVTAGAQPLKILLRQRSQEGLKDCGEEAFTIVLSGQGTHLVERDL